MRASLVFLIFCGFASSGFAAGADANRGSVRASASVSVSVPAMTSVDLRVTAADISLNVFQTGSSVIVMRYSGARESVPVSLQGNGMQNALAIGGGGRWTTIRDRFTDDVQRVSTRRRASESITYEIWHF
jgi:hypothetical protein